jgi:PAS domain S-box-containing protein
MDELATMTRLHELSTRLTAPSDLSSLLYEVLDAIMELQGADFGDVQLYDEAAGTLRIVAHRGLDQAFLDYFEAIDASDTSACGLALRTGRRIIIEDVNTAVEFEPHRAIAAATGFRGVQSTPLFDRNTGKPLGMLSTHFREPYRAFERELRLTDLYARQAADVIAFRLAEQRLRDRDEHLRLALEAAQMGTWEVDGPTGLLKADAAFQALFGLPPQTQPQPSEVYWAQMMPEEVRLGVEHAKAAIENGTDTHLQQRVIRPDGEVRWVVFRGRPKGGNSKSIFGISYDVTERVRTEQALRESQARLQAAADLIGLALYAWNPQSNAVKWDVRVKAMWGLPPDAPVDYDVWHNAVHPDDLARVDAAVAKALAPDGDGIYGIEYRVIPADGVERWVATRGQTIFDKGRPVEFNGVALDITERKRAEEALRESEARLSAILTQIPLGVGLVDRDGRFILRAGSLGSLWHEIMPSRDPAQNKRWRAYDADGRLLTPPEYPGARALRGETVVPGVDFIHTSDAGRETWIRGSAAPFRNGSGEIEGAVVILLDVDDEKRAEQAKEVMIAELQHRTRNILSVVRTVARQTRAASHSLEDFAVEFNDRLSALSRVQGLLSRGDEVDVTLGELVHMELDALGAERDGVRIIVGGPEIALPKRSVQLLALALHELATNALKHGALDTPRGRLKVEWQVRQCNGGDCRLKIEWREYGLALGQDKAKAVHRGYGRELVERALPYQLDADTRFDLLDDGVRYSIEMSLIERVGVREN